MLTLGLMGITPEKYLEMQFITSFPISHLLLFASRTPPTITRGKALFPSAKITDYQSMHNIHNRWRKDQEPVLMIQGFMPKNLLYFIRMFQRPTQLVHIQITLSIQDTLNCANSKSINLTKNNVKIHMQLQHPENI